MPIRLVALTCVTVLCSSSLRAQRVTEVVLPPRVAVPAWRSTTAREASDARGSPDEPGDRFLFPSPDTTRDSAGRRGTGWSILASALLPGAGQAMRRERRALVYVAIEAFAWSNYASHRRVARRTRDSYRTLASDVARAPFSSVRPVGDFDYYERMKSFVSSGRFDLSDGALPLQPEVDTVTFNGATWLLARRTYWNDPSQPPPRGSVEWARAEAFYLQRAVRAEYRWSWEGATEQQERFRQLIQRSNDRYRASLSNLGLALGNHFLSAIDASIALRLDQRQTALGREYRISAELPYEILR